MEGYLPKADACKTLNIHHHTLYKMMHNGEIETKLIGKRNFFNVKKYLDERGIITNLNINRRKICYCRVSSQKQKEDLKRQIEYMKKEYPYSEIITDIASGINYERPGLQKILKYAMNGEIEELVIAYKDRLTRFGFEMIEWIIKEKSNGKIKILNTKEETTPMEEVSKDILSIMNVYVAKINGLRKYKKQLKKELKEGQ